MPASADAGQPIHILVNISSPVQIREVGGVVLYYRNPGTGQEDWVFMNLTVGSLTDGTWSYDIPAQPWAGQLQCYAEATDNGGLTGRYPASGYHAIELVGEEAPKPFPWNIAIIVCFLAVALIFTELAFKPGVYRQTGKDKARRLEEDDRLREERQKEDEDTN
jgi:hypothetical protein